jgi:hypothetical protein
MLASTLHAIKKEKDYLNSKKNSTINNMNDLQNLNDETTTEYLDYFGIENIAYENELNRFNEFILKANIKSVSYSLKIYSIQLFEMCFLE